MNNKTPHQVLGITKQTEIDKSKIEYMLRTHTFDENIELVYQLINQCCNGNKHIDEYIDLVIEKCKNNKNLGNSFGKQFFKDSQSR